MVHDLAPQIFSHLPATCLMSKSDLNLEYSGGRSQRTGIGRASRPLNSIQPWSAGDAFLREKKESGFRTLTKQKGMFMVEM